MRRALWPWPRCGWLIFRLGVDDRFHRINRKRVRLAARLHHHPQTAVDH